MKLIRKIDSLYILALSKLKVFKIKLINSSNLIIGDNCNFKSTSRLKVWSGGTIVIGKNFNLGYNSEIYSWNEELTIGNNTSINDNCKIYGDVKIGANCLLASNIFISSGSHSYKFDPYLPIKVQDTFIDNNNDRVVIEDDCWIGFGAVIMQGVYIGKGAIIGSNTVVTKDVEPFSVNAGIPNKQISKRIEFNQGYYRIDCNIKEHWPFFYKGMDYSQFNNTDKIIKYGIEIQDKISVFLLSKKSNLRLLLSGRCQTDIKLEIMLNDSKYVSLDIFSGDFHEICELENTLEYSFDYYKNIPDSIKQLFNIITIRTEGMKTLKKIQNWQIKSIGYFES